MMPDGAPAGPRTRPSIPEPGPLRPARDQQTIADRLAAIELASRYARNLDLGRWDAFLDLFADEVDIVLPEWTASPQGRIPAGAWMAFCREALMGFDATQHLVTNHLVETDQAGSRVYAHMTARHVYSASETEFLGGFYEFGLQRDEARGWKIGAVTLTVTWEEGARQLFHKAHERGRRRLADAAHEPGLLDH